MDTKDYFELLLKNIDDVHSSVNKLDEKVEKVEEKNTSISETLVRNTASLEHHIKRTNILENELKIFKVSQDQHMKEDVSAHKDLSERLKKIEMPRKFLMWLVAGISTVVGLTVAIINILRFIGKG